MFLKPYCNKVCGVFFKPSFATYAKNLSLKNSYSLFFFQRITHPASRALGNSASQIPYLEQGYPCKAGSLVPYKTNFQNRVSGRFLRPTVLNFNKDKQQVMRDFSLRVLPKNEGNNGELNKKSTEDIRSSKITYEEIGLFPRSFNRVFDRFLKQVFSDVENLVLQEYRFYRYLFLTTLKTLFLLFFVPFLVNLVAKNYFIRPLTEFLWNTKQPEIFLNAYQQKRAFAELHNFEETLFFESLISFPKQQLISNIDSYTPYKEPTSYLEKPVDNTARLDLKDTKLLSNITIRKENSQSSNLIFVNPDKYLDSSFNLNSSTYSNPPERGEERPSGEPPLKRNPTGFSGPGVAFEPPLKVNPTEVESILNPNFRVKPLHNSFNVGYGTDLNKNGEYINNSFSYKEDIIFESTKKLQEKTMELATWYNKNSIEAITNILSDFLSFIALIYLLISLEIQINVTKSFLLEVFFGLEDSKKSLFILLITDLLVGYHSPNIWEFFFQLGFNHYGIPESQTVIFLLVATLPVLLDVLFKYLIFRHLNRSSPATVATYHAMIE